MGEKAREVVGVRVAASLAVVSLGDGEHARAAQVALDELYIAQGHPRAPGHIAQTGVGQILVPLMREDIRDEPDVLSLQPNLTLVVKDCGGNGRDTVLQDHTAEPSFEA